MSKSLLKRILDGFQRVAKGTAERLIKATIATKLATLSDNPIIHIPFERSRHWDEVNDQQNLGPHVTQYNRISDLAAISKDLVHVRSMLLRSFESVKKYQILHQEDHDDSMVIRNPLKVRSKGRPKTGAKRFMTESDKQPNRQKKRKPHPIKLSDLEQN